VNGLYEHYKQRLPYLDLPKTITDAFQVTKEMGLRYIWIDSLCIIQDNNEDKQTEMAIIMQIYQNAQFTISAASASSVEQGFLRLNLHDSRTVIFHHPLRVDERTMGSILISHETLSNFADACARPQPINTRGWTLQEMLFTPRVLIFTNMHMVWRCQTGYMPNAVTTSDSSRASRDRPNQWETWSIICGYDFISLKSLEATATRRILGIGEVFLRKDDLYSTWQMVLRRYADRLLTIPSDRLLAISAVARAFASYFKAPYYAGLWGNYIEQGLMWYSSAPDVKISGPPSWSWATANAVSYPYLGDVSVKAEVISCKTTLLSDKNPFGEVTGGELVIPGQLKPVWLNLEDDEILDHDADTTFFWSDGKLEKWEASLSSLNHIAILCLVLGETPTALSSTTHTTCRMMALVECQERKDCYRRIGLVEAKSAPPYWWEDWDRVTVTIV